MSANVIAYGEPIAVAAYCACKMTKHNNNVIQFPRRKRLDSTDLPASRCPVCESTSVARILAGMALEGSLHGADTSHFVYAGSFDNGDAQWHCNVCDREW